MREEDYLMLSGIQHFCFCRRQWALIHIEGMWDENMLTAEGHVMHERVHDSDVSDIRNGVLTLRGLNIKSDKLGISGTCDAVEFHPDPAGISLAGRDGTWRVRPVEYKHGEPKVNDCDRLQVTAQAMCLEEMLGCKIETADLYYGSTRHREHIEITDQLRDSVIKMCAEMHDMADRKYTPKVKPTNACKNCSLEYLCLPKLQSMRASVHEFIAERLNDKTE